MTKADLVDEISGRTKISKSETATIVDQLLNAISRALIFEPRLGSNS